MHDNAPRTLRVESQDAGRADTWLAAATGVTRGYARRLLARGVARLDGRPLVKGATLRAGDRVEIAPFRHPEQGLLPDPRAPLRILAEARGWIAVDKPAGQATHPLDFDERGSALQALAALRPGVLTAGDEPLAGGSVHRLDLETSGVLLFADTPEAWRRARAAFAERRVRKDYLARVHGRVRGERDLELRLDNRGAGVAVVPSGGREARLRIEPLESDADTSLVRVRLYTGVRHQIRVSLAWLGHPVVGDARYGARDGLDRHLLHAERLAIDDFDAHAPAPECLLQSRSIGGRPGR